MFGSCQNFGLATPLLDNCDTLPKESFWPNWSGKDL